MDDIIATFILFFAVVNPFGVVPIFIAVTGGYDEKTKKRVALKTILISTLILVFFVIAGEVILTAISIPLSAFKVAGGLVLFLFALTMIFETNRPSQTADLTTSANEIAIFPLAVPSIAGPGTILAAILLTENDRFNLGEQLVTTLVMFSVLLFVLGLLLAASWVHRLIRESGSRIVSRIMGLILASIAVANVAEGIKEYFKI